MTEKYNNKKEDLNSKIKDTQRKIDHVLAIKARFESFINELKSKHLFEETNKIPVVEEQLSKVYDSLETLTSERNKFESSLEALEESFKSKLNKQAEEINIETVAAPFGEALETVAALLGEAPETVAMPGEAETVAAPLGEAPETVATLLLKNLSLNYLSVFSKSRAQLLENIYKFTTSNLKNAANSGVDNIKLYGPQYVPIIDNWLSKTANVLQLFMLIDSGYSYLKSRGAVQAQEIPQEQKVHRSMLDGLPKIESEINALIDESKEYTSPKKFTSMHSTFVKTVATITNAQGLEKAQSARDSHDNSGAFSKENYERVLRGEQVQATTTFEASQQPLSIQSSYFKQSSASSMLSDTSPFSGFLDETGKVLRSKSDSSSPSIPRAADLSAQSESAAHAAEGTFQRISSAANEPKLLSVMSGLSPATAEMAHLAAPLLPLSDPVPPAVVLASAAPNVAAIAEKLATHALFGGNLIKAAALEMTILLINSNLPKYTWDSFKQYSHYQAPIIDDVVPYLGVGLKISINAYSIFNALAHIYSNHNGMTKLYNGMTKLVVEAAATATIIGVPIIYEAAKEYIWSENPIDSFEIPSPLIKEEEAGLLGEP